MKISRLRAALLLLIFIPITGWFAHETGFDAPAVAYGFVAVLAISPFVAAFGNAWLQTLFRGIWLSFGTWGLLGFFASGSEHWEPLAFAAGFGLAVLVAGHIPQSSKFQPTRFRRTLTASLVFGFADFVSLSVLGTFTLYVFFKDPYSDTMFQPIAIFALGCAIPLGVALYGLYRTKVWGLVLCLTMNLVVAGLALSGVVEIPDPLVYMLVATAGIQLLLPIPLIAAIITRKSAVT